MLAPAGGEEVVQPVSQLDVTRRGVKLEARHVATSDP
jgi:hypothetical protein